MDTLSTPSTVDNMRTEAEFLEQAELSRSALQQFIAVKDFENADELKRTALNKVMKNTVCFSFIRLRIFSLTDHFLATFQ
jgi:hypothetical protein